MTIKSLYPTVRPSLNLDFAKTKALDPRVTFTRASTATFVGADGLIQTAASGAARFDHNPATGESLGLLVEEARTNILQYSEQFDNAYWTNVGLTWTANNVVAPDGLTTADTPSSNNITQVVGVYVNSTFIGQSTSLVTTSWNRVSVTFTTDASTTSINLYPLLNAGSNIYNVKTVTVSANTTYTFSCFYRLSGSIIIPWGAQLEAGSFPTSYIPTVASTVTRAADVASMTGTNFSSWYRQDEGTLLASAIPFSPSATNFVADMDEGAVVNEIGLAVSSTSFWGLVYNSGSYQVDLRYGTPVANSKFLASLAYKANNFQLSANGVAYSPDTSGSVPAMARMTIGSRTNTANWLNGTIARLAYYPVRLPNAQLQALTAT